MRWEKTGHMSEQLRITPTMVVEVFQGTVQCSSATWVGVKFCDKLIKDGGTFEEAKRFAEAWIKHEIARAVESVKIMEAPGEHIPVVNVLYRPED
jgi:hypothetical protein